MFKIASFVSMWDFFVVGSMAYKTIRRMVGDREDEGEVLSVVMMIRGIMRWVMSLTDENRIQLHLHLHFLVSTIMSCDGPGTCLDVL